MSRSVRKEILVYLSLLLFVSVFQFPQASVDAVGVEGTAEADGMGARVLSLLEQAEAHRDSESREDIVISVMYHKAHLSEYGVGIDRFLGPRPWWVVRTEPYEWQGLTEGTTTKIELRRLASERYDAVLQSIARRQYPSDCETRRLRVTFLQGFSSFGNNFFNFNNDAAYCRASVYVPYIHDPNTLATNFLDPGSCPSVHNKFECAFLPTTNCSIPRISSQHNFYSQATPSAKQITKEEFDQPIVKRDRDHEHALEHVKNFESVVSGGLAESSGPWSKTHIRPAYQQLFTYAFLFRLNYDFRRLVAQETKRFEVNSTTFPTKGKCVTVNMRKDPDRAPIGVNVSEFCKNASLGIRPPGNDGARMFSAFHNYGCHTSNPYGMITLDDFVKGAGIVSNSTFIYGTTDNARWLDHALRKYSKPPGYTIVPYAAPPNHRKSATVSGVQYIASLFLARKCSAFVGNSGSAVSALYMNLLCVEHGNVFGRCPPFFDFSHGQNVRNFDPQWTSMHKKKNNGR